MKPGYRIPIDPVVLISMLRPGGEYWNPDMPHAKAVITRSPIEHDDVHVARVTVDDEGRAVLIVRGGEVPGEVEISQQVRRT